MILRRLLACGITLLLLTSCQVHNNIWDTTKVEVGANNLLVIRTMGQMTSEITKDEKLPIDMKGVAIPLKDNYIIALTHCTKVPKSIPYLFMNVLVQPIGEIKHSILIGGVERRVKLIGRFRDLSLFKADFEIKPYPFKLAEKFVYAPGINVLNIGFSFNQFFNTKDGLISSDKFSELAKKDLSLLDMFSVSIPANPGDSGSPVLAVGNTGDYEIIGLVTMSWRGSQGITICLKSTFISEAIEILKLIYKLNNNKVAVEIE